MQYLKRTLTVLLPCLYLLVSNAFAANSYQSEFSGGYSEIERSSSTEITSLTASFYLSPVNTEDKPLAAAAFLDKSSSITIGFSRQQVKTPQSPMGNAEIDGSSIGGNYITEKSGYIFSVGFRNSDFLTDNNQTSADFETKALRFGKYLDDWSSLEFDYQNNETKNIVSSSNILFIDSKVYSLNYTTIRPINKQRYYGLGVRAGLLKGSDDRKNQLFSVSGGYYMNRLTSFSAAISTNSGDRISIEGNTFGIGTQHFFTPQITLGARLAKFIAKDSSTQDSDSYSIFISSRF